MKAISLWQPWASLCIQGLKQYETRSWTTAYRGDLVIHAAKRPLTRADYDLVEFWEVSGFVDDEFAWFLNHDPRYFGAALGIVTLTAIYRTEPLLPKIDAQEQAFGNYGSGRYAWRLENPRPFLQPIPYRGKQGMWTWDIDAPETTAAAQ